MTPSEFAAILPIDCSHVLSWPIGWVHALLFGENRLELLAVITGILSVLFTIRRSVWCWPIGLVNAVLYGIVFFEAMLYADVFLQVVYFILGIYGWLAWIRGYGTDAELPVSRLRMRHAILLVGLWWIGGILWGASLHQFTDAAYPWIDALLAAASLIAQVLIARKVLESWWIWIAVDILYMPLYASRGLYLTTGLYGVFLVLAILGERDWRKAMRDR